MRSHGSTRVRSFLAPTRRLLVTIALAAVTTACSPPDATVQADVQQQLAADATTSAAHLAVTVKDGVARISGETETMAVQTRALDIARAVKGVRQVDSAMRMNDAALTKAVQSAIAADPDASKIPLTVEVQGGEVHLMSNQTNADQRARLVTIAKGVPGVTHVEDRMR